MIKAKMSLLSITIPFLLLCDFSPTPNKVENEPYQFPIIEIIERVEGSTLEVTPKETPIVEASPTPIYLGEYKVTHYGLDCMGCVGDGITASGTNATEGRTVALYSGLLPYGTLIYINGKEYVLEDCGVPMGLIDIYVGSEEYAKELGTYRAEVHYILQE